MILNNVDFDLYCHKFPFSKKTLEELASTIDTINPQDTTQIFKVIENVEELSIENIQLILIPNKLSVIVYQSKEDASCYNFGFFESINDELLVRQCFNYIFNTIVRDFDLIGPVNFSTFFNYRFKLNYFDRPNFLGEPNNLFYYPKLLESVGFKIDKSYQSQYASAQTFDEIISNELNIRYLEARKKNFKISSISADSILDHIEGIYDLVVGQFTHKSKFNPISYKLFKEIYVDEIINYVHPKYSFAYYYEKKLIAFNFMFDHKQYSLDHGLEYSNTCSDLIYKTVCIHKDFQRKGLFKLMLAYTYSQYPHGISTTGATMENTKFVVKYSDKYPDVKTIEYALYKKAA